MKKVKLFALTLFVCIGLSCEKNDQVPKACLKGKLVLTGICMNYVIELVEGDVDPALIQKLWVNPITNREYKNVFALGNVCDFPANIREGQEFYFSLNDSADNTSCPRCMAYSPVPEKKLYIKICNTN